MANESDERGMQGDLEVEGRKREEKLKTLHRYGAMSFIER
uniref:Uncharacterized protein n=1 Tax=Vibrio tasmaniensis TaxID=212663 RepID=A0A0H3ZQZ3_9VIBR|nr:hypothetical protein [Vibrio tasmaniensis]